MNIPDPRQRPTLTVREAAEVLGIGVQTYYEGAARGNLPALRLSPRRIVVPTAQLWALLGMEPPP
jgi:excisionase family DNA binding protein